MKKKKTPITGNNVFKLPLSFLPFLLSFLFIYTHRKIQLPSKNLCDFLSFFCDVEACHIQTCIASSKHASVVVVAEKKHLQLFYFIHDSSQFNPQISKTGPSLDTKGLTLTHKRVKMEASKIDQTNTMVGILSCFPSKPFKNG